MERIMPNKKEEIIKFDAEVGKVLQLMIHSLYTNKDIFLRELVSNASDACDKLRYLAVMEQGLIQGDSNFKITISTDAKERTITIEDNGIGMNREELIENIGTIARSGTQRFMEQMTGDSKKDVNLIGQFGVGFYSSFMVADKVTVISRKAGEQSTWRWESDGQGEYHLKETIIGNINRGTRVTLHLRSGEDDYLEEFRIKHIIKTYSNHISIPINLHLENGKEEVINKATAIWTRSKSDITEEEYKEFYKSVSYQPDSPWMTLHNKNEGVVEYTNLLFIPETKPFDLFHPDRKARVKLYVKKIYITDDNVDLVPAYLRFIRGIIDSEDLPLNISRETLQNNHVIEKIRNSVSKKIIGELKKKLDNDRDAYLKFWNNFGAVLKEGLCEGLNDKQDLLEICLFKSALSEKLISLKEYVAEMLPDQQFIYYLCGADAEQLKNSPQLEGLLKKGFDVLLFTDSVDDFWVNTQNEYQEKELKSATRSGIEFDDTKSEPENENEEQKKAEQDLVAFFKEALKQFVSDVRPSRKLVDSPACLAVPEGAMDIRMERFLIEQKQIARGTAKILEINLQHPLLRNISEDIIANKTERAADLARLLFDQACILEGEPVADVSLFAKKMNQFLQEV